MPFSQTFGEWIIFPVALSVAWALTLVVRRLAVAYGQFDVPNERSSHISATPRGGGLAMAVPFLTCLPFLMWQDIVTKDVTIGLSGAGVLVTVVGYIDDRRQVAVGWRLLIHFVSAAWVLYWVGTPYLKLFGEELALGLIGVVFFGLYLVWILNLYNFMDGIDGLAATEAATVCVGALLVQWLTRSEVGAAVPLLLLASVLGFLAWNFPPAKIFMGDAGSGFLGLTLGAMSIAASRSAPEAFWAWLILLGVFTVDATVTLLRRLSRGERVYMPHRTHAYQYASRQLRSHMRVTLFVATVNLVWLVPLASLVATGLLEGIVGLAIAYTPLIWLAFRFKAGARELQD